jgi:acetyl esterase/lipase
MLKTPTTYIYKTVGGCQIKADVYRQSAGSTPTAAIIYIHGGCLIYGSRKDIDQKQLELYLGAGYAVVSIDYRLAPESKLPEIIEDLRDAFRWVRASGPDLCSLDPQRIAVVGHSAGGYLALMSGFCVMPHPQAIVAFYGYGNIVGEWYSKPDPFYCMQPAVSEEESGRLSMGPVISEPYEGRGKDKFYLYCRQRGLWPQEVGGHDPENEASFFTQYCPTQNVSPDYPPTLLLHGDQDTDVPHEQSVLMAKELARHQVKHELITMPQRGHGFDKDMDDSLVRDVFNKVLSFLDRHTRNEEA